MNNCLDLDELVDNCRLVQNLSPQLFKQNKGLTSVEKAGLAYVGPASHAQWRDSERTFIQKSLHFPLTLLVSMMVFGLMLTHATVTMAAPKRFIK